jgi:hypothetical protein
VSHVAEFVNALRGGGALLALRVEHVLHQLGNIIERRRLGRGGGLGRCLFSYS